MAQPGNQGPPKGSSCEMVVARIAVWRYPSHVQGTRAIRGRFRIAALLFTDEAVVSGMVSCSRRSAHAGVRRTTTRPDLGCGKAAKKGRGELFLARQFAAAVTALFLAAGAFFVFLFTVSDLHAKDPGSSCAGAGAGAGAGEVAVLSSPIA